MCHLRDGRRLCHYVCHETESRSVCDSLRHAATRVAQYYAMFDVNVTTSDAVRRAAGIWAWILVTPDFDDGGEAWVGGSSVGVPQTAQAISSLYALTDEDRAVTIAHELGHNFTLRGVGGTDRVADAWDAKPNTSRTIGPVMGDDWVDGADATYVWANIVNKYGGAQNAMDIIRRRVAELAGSGTGWRKDDFPEDTKGTLCERNGVLYGKGVLGSPDDVDTWSFNWPGGGFRFSWSPVGVSAAEVDARVLCDGLAVGKADELRELEGGTCEIQVHSTGEYGLIGEYEISIE